MDPGDEDLVARAIAGNDTRAFGELVRRYQGRVRSWLWQLSGDGSWADDLAQETFVRAWQKLATFTGKGKFSAWIMKIAYNEFLQDRRKMKSAQRLKTTLTAEESAQSTIADSRLPDLPKFLTVLSEDERVVVILCHGYGYSHHEASELTGIPLGTVKSHVRRGVTKIRDRFEIRIDGDE